MKYEFVICYEEPQHAYFKCNKCGALVVVDYPSDYDEQEEVYNNLVRQHKHKGA